MVLSKPIAKLIPGLVFTVVGFLLSNTYFSKHPLFNLPYFAQTMIGFLAGAFGSLILPALLRQAQKWFIGVVQATIQTTVAKAMAGFIATQKKTVLESHSVASQARKASRQARKAEKVSNSNAVILDTSAIIDGRIFDVARAGFIRDKFIVPNFVLRELQAIADSSNDLKRQRGRRGLKLLKDAQKDRSIAGPTSMGSDLKHQGQTLPSSKSGLQGIDVDSQLVALAKKLKARLATVDFNLNQVATVSGVKVLNVNELANIIKTVVLPGEVLNIKLVQKGKESSQGVGYLEDGTMIVVEGGGEQIGKKVDIVVSRLLQTSAGKMIFGIAKN